ARGQTVRWWLYGGDDKINAFVKNVVTPAARELGVTVMPVRVDDTANAVQRVIAERRAGKLSGGSVDLIWINGENFLAGKQDGLWRRGWLATLPNVRYVNLGDPTINRDFTVPIDGQESPWQRAAFNYAYDPAKVPDPPRTFDALLAYARKHPGRVTYPAPPDFTGSAFVRTLVKLEGADAAFRYLKELRPLQYRGGKVFPKSEAELDQLFSDGQVDFAMSYNPSFVFANIQKGAFPKSSRPLIIGPGALVNTSYVTIPADAAHVAGALVLANILLDPRIQAIMADPAKGLGSPTVLDKSRLSTRQRARFQGSASPYVLSHFGHSIEDGPSKILMPIEDRWQREILRGG
ncbi:MAG: ABC transporter substrate-binding protein, partial [Solirubrobacteraceae bacterium]